MTRLIISGKKQNYDGVGMDCPHCGSKSLIVTDSRGHRGHIRRRRTCSDCGHRFFTKEVITNVECEDIGERNGIKIPTELVANFMVGFSWLNRLAAEDQVIIGKTKRWQLKPETIEMMRKTMKALMRILSE